MQNCKEELKKLNNPNILMSKMYSFDEVRQLLEQQRSEFLNQKANQHDQAVREQLKSEMLKIIAGEIALTHFGKRGKTSGLASAFNRINQLIIK